MISLMFDEDNISCENDKYRDLHLLNNTYKISVGDIFMVGSKKYSTVETHSHNGMFSMLNITEGKLERDMPFDSIYEMLNTKFRNCIISFLTYSEINNNCDRKNRFDYADSYIKCKCGICTKNKAILGTINTVDSKMPICEECADDLRTALNKAKDTV